MRLALILPLLLLAGCGPRTPATVAEYESDHPYSKLEHVFPAVPELGSNEVRQYSDRVPSITGDGAYSATPRTDTLIVKDGKVVSFDRQEGF
jgi:hypothetical protein